MKSIQLNLCLEGQYIDSIRETVESILRLT